MRIVAFSDTHMSHHEVKLPLGDVLVFAGDCCNYGTLQEVRSFAKWLEAQPHEYKLFVPGNHDWPFETKGTPNNSWANVGPTVYTQAVKAIENAGASILIDTKIKIEDRIFYGSPYQPRFYNWAFNIDRNSKEMEETWNRIPDDTEILITHGPAVDVLDKNENKQPCGCELLRDRIQELPDLKLHIFGHIHEGYGVWPPIAPDKNHYIAANVAISSFGPKLNDPFIYDL